MVVAAIRVSVACAVVFVVVVIADTVTIRVSGIFNALDKQNNILFRLFVCCGEYFL